MHAILQGFIRGACQSGARNCVSAANFRDSESGMEVLRGGNQRWLHGGIQGCGGQWSLGFGVRILFSGYALPFTPYRRHLLVTEPLSQVNPRWPVVWMVGRGILLPSGERRIADERVRHRKGTAGTGRNNRPRRTGAHRGQGMPAGSLLLPDAGVARAWAGMRTFVPDDHFVIGKDPRLQGLYWVAGLGGHGITCAPAIGTLAADWIVDGHSDHPAAMALWRRTD